VTSADVAAAVADQTGVMIDRKHLDVEPIKSVGQHTVTAHLHTDVSFPITVEVVSA
jgi:ribosomal protein L9